MELYKKSSYNLQSAENLIASGLFAPSVHCSYYSCFQTAVNKYLDCSERVYSDVQKEIKEKKNLNVHSFYIDRLVVLIKNTKDPNRFRIAKSIETDYKNLKELRVNADYHNVEMQKEKAQSAFETSKKLNVLLKSIR